MEEGSHLSGKQLKHIRGKILSQTDTSRWIDETLRMHPDWEASNRRGRKEGSEFGAGKRKNCGGGRRTLSFVK